uniref:Nitroreductase family protein n=1 Tax=Candidatus Desulfatibia profunda TaxID=2841695 RepID=A0A8J6NQ12_9BACT|nr:nitroreductase family protein [Candidatus Desulfatibia profunda]
MFLSLVQKRRSIREYLQKPVESKKIDMLVEAALRSPSSRGFNPWEFIVVTDRNLLAKLSKAKPHGASFLSNAPLGIVVCADPAKCDVWIEDVSIASIFLHLAAESLELGSCWIQIRMRMHNRNKTAEAYIRELLHIPENLNVESIVAIGYPAESKPAHPKEDLQYEKVHFNEYGKPLKVSSS